MPDPAGRHKKLAGRSNVRTHLYAGTQLAVSVLLGFFIGYKLDQNFGTFPWLMLLGALGGIGLGLYSFLRMFLKNDRSGSVRRQKLK